jgi:hypothetical protein
MVAFVVRTHVRYTDGVIARPMDDADLPDLDGVLRTLRRVLAELEPRCLSRSDAVRLVGAFAEVERLGAAGRMLAAAQVERSGAWKGSGHRSAAHWMARATGTSVGQAVGSLQTARHLEDLPTIEGALRAGELSEPQVREVAQAAAAAPSSQAELVAAARSESVPALRETCRRLRASGTDSDAAYERLRRDRYLRHWTDPQGALRLEARLTPDDGARVLAGMEPHRRRIFASARAAGRREPSCAYDADALVAAVEAGASSGPAGSSPGAVVHVRVDRSALVRGHAERGERCEIPGVGPIPVGAARRLASDAILKVVLTEGADVTGVAHLGRTIPARLRTALEARDPTCVVPGCDVRHGLEIDHRVPYAEGGPTTLGNLARLCRWHHSLKTHRRWRLDGGPGSWTWSGPDPPQT